MKKASFEARDEDERACEKEVVERARAAACVVGWQRHLCDTFHAIEEPKKTR